MSSVPLLNALALTHSVSLQMALVAAPPNAQNAVVRPTPARARLATRALPRPDPLLLSPLVISQILVCTYRVRLLPRTPQVTGQPFVGLQSPVADKIRIAAAPKVPRGRL